MFVCVCTHIHSLLTYICCTCALHYQQFLQKMMILESCMVFELKNRFTNLGHTSTISQYHQSLAVKKFHKIYLAHLNECNFFLVIEYCNKFPFISATEL